MRNTYLWLDHNAFNRENSQFFIYLRSVKIDVERYMTIGETLAALNRKKENRENKIILLCSSTLLLSDYIALQENQAVFRIDIYCRYIPKAQNLKQFFSKIHNIHTKEAHIVDMMKN